jgi:hypothetical protein
MPADQAYPINEIIQQFREVPGSRSLWRRLIRDGAVRASVTESTCSVACDCDRFDDCRRWIEEALGRSGLASRWVA